jgi:serine/threonine protein kinase
MTTLMNPSTLNGMTEVGGYRLLRSLGEGGMGEVYLGESPAGVKVAIKLIRELLVDENYRHRFARETDMMKAALGLGVAHFAAADADGDPPWLATEFVPGVNLAEHVERYGPLTTVQAAMLGARLSEGLEAIHKAELLHRDLKPRNVMMGPDGPKIVDFGLAVLRERPPDTDLTLTGMAVGSPQWRAPEQAIGAKDLKPSADAYALGLTIAYATTGRLPLRGESIDVEGIAAPLASILTDLASWQSKDRLDLVTAKRRFLALATHGRSLADAVTDLIQATYARHTDPHIEDDPNPDLPEPVEEPQRPTKTRVAPSAARALDAATRIRTDYAKTSEL